ncbi:hypothetical protein [Parasphingorhabdus sp.]|uniref:hypothetical protein n=1 Tax=Parasphingorhabdus sp. TaxID=2709688 RepID=UPI002B266F06|nr:hypothetical protein [Parasphingorhabdus sp.]
MRVTFSKSPEWFPSARPKGLERLFVREPIAEYTSQYVHMFLQDLEHLVPLGSRKERDGYFELETNDKPLAMKVVTALDRQYHSPHLGDALRHFLSSTAMELFFTGHSIIKLTVKFDEFKWEVSSLHPSATRIVSFGPFLLQVLPERDNQGFSRDFEIFPSELRFLSAKDILRIQLPTSLRRRRKRLIRRLRLLSDLSYPDTEKLFPRTSLENPSPKNNFFDFSMFRKNFDIALFQTIRETGWMARDYSGDEKSDFFTSVWRLRFRKFQASLRMDIIRQLNEKIPKIIHQVNPDFKMTIKEKGMLTPDELTEMEQQLYAGEISFKTVIDSTFNR